MKRYTLFTLSVLTLAFSLHGESPSATIGSIWATGTYHCPVNTLPADGRTLNISEHTALYSLFGTTYGGDGLTTFGIPDLRTRTPVGVGVGKNDTGTDNLIPIALGQSRGQQTVVLTAANLPAHTHAATFTPSEPNQITVNIIASSNVSGNANAPSPSHNYVAASSPNRSGAQMWSGGPGKTPVKLAGISVSGGGIVIPSYTGENKPVPIRPPELGVLYCVTVNGIYPQRP